MKKKKPTTGKPSRSVPKRTSPLRPVLQKVRSNVLFSGVNARRITALLPKLKLQRYKPGEMIFNEFSQGKELFLIIEGVVRIKKFTKYGVESLLAVLHEGDFFGELSIIDGLPRSARAEAVHPCAIVRFDAEHFRQLIKNEDAFTFNVLQNLARRLRTMDQTFVLELERNELSSRTKLDKLHLLVDASKTVNSSLDLDVLLVAILDAATRSTSADRGTLYLMDEKTGELWSKTAQGTSEIRLPPGKGLAGYVAKTGETVNIPDAYADPRFNPEIDKRSGYKTHNVLCMPMRDRDGKIVGVFQLLNKTGGTFTPEDESFIDAFSVHAALALENARIARDMVNNERMSAVGRMASSIIHDIKNPMGTLRMYAQVIKTTGNEEAAQIADEMIRQVDRFVHMSQDILDFSRGVSEMKRTTVALGDVLDDVLGFIRLDLTKKSIALQREIEYRGPITIDVEKIVRVFYNLASNAADAMPQGGRLTVSTAEKGDSIVMTFADTGIGMTDEVRAKVFEPFFSHGKKRGTGLGLSIVKKIIEDHNGRIELASEAGKGTTITISIPKAG
ncbi:MAG: ATP-binding protein [Bacteroidota bacterium]